jgi:hypothetical protein
MPNQPKTVIVTGASQGIGAALVKTLLERGYSVVATSRDMTKSRAFIASDKLTLVDGDIGQMSTAANIVETATSKFGSIDARGQMVTTSYAVPHSLSFYSSGAIRGGDGSSTEIYNKRLETCRAPRERPIPEPPESGLRRLKSSARLHR